MSQLLELWKKLKHKLADRRFLLSLLPALLIALLLLFKKNEKRFQKE